MSRLQPKEVEAVSIEIARLDTVGGEEQLHVIREFAEANPGHGLSSVGGLDLAKELVEKALGNKAADTLENVQQTIEALPFGFLKKVDPQNVLTFINDEHPQTIALILSHLPPSYGAEIIARLPAERQLQVIRRIATMGQTSPDVIREVEEGLSQRMSSVMSHSFERAGGPDSVAEILNVTDRNTERSLLENLSQEDPELADEIRRLMFVFEDINNMSDKDIQAVLKNVETQQWAMALKGASQELKERILANMSKRAAQMLQEEMEYLGAVKLSEVESVQQQIVDIVRGLEDLGEISTHPDDSDDELVE